MGTNFFGTTSGLSFGLGLVRQFTRRLACLGFAGALLFLTASTFALADTAQSPIPLPSPFTPVVDNANVIDADTRKKLESIYLNLKQRGLIEFAVVTVDTTGDLDIFDYSLAVARGWGIGSNEGDKAGFLLLVAIKDRKYFTQVSRHLEADLNDGLVGQIQRDRLVPQFKKRNYAQGIYDTVQAYAATLAAKRGFSIDGIDQRYAYREEPEREHPSQVGSTEGLSGAVCTGIIILFVIIIAIASRGGGRGGRGGGGGGDWWKWALVGSLINAATSSRGSSSGWSGGGFGGGGGGGGGGGFGGGFGGGGDFGGGGSGGSW